MNIAICDDDIEFCTTLKRQSVNCRFNVVQNSI